MPGTSEIGYDESAANCLDVARQRQVHDVPTVDDLCQWQADIVNWQPELEKRHRGALRDCDVWVGNYKGSPPGEILRELKILYVIERHVPEISVAFRSHLQFEITHPFVDGNGRTGRLLEAHLLRRAGVENPERQWVYYWETRSDYYRALSVGRENPQAFVDYAMQGPVGND